MAGLMTRAKRAVNVLLDKEATEQAIPREDRIFSYSPPMLSRSVAYDTKRAVLAPIVTRISIDCAQIPMRHIKVNQNGSLSEYVKSELNDRLVLKANLDQSGRAFKQEAVKVMLSEGYVALVPVELTVGTYDILSMRVGAITKWYNRSIGVEVYNELSGQIEEIVVPKEFAAIAYNPLHEVMNKPNSTLQRLVDRLSILDVADGKINSPQLDLIIQLPYTLRNERRVQEANERIATVVEQLENSQYGIAYIDANEHLTQLNRPVANNLVQTVVTLTESLHSQLGLTPAIFSGQASQEDLITYNNRTVLPIVRALTDAMNGAFFTRTAITQGHRIWAYPELFSMAPINVIAEAADTLTRNEIMTTNEVRDIVGLLPSRDPAADELRNKNLNRPEPTSSQPVEDTQVLDDQKENEYA